MCKVNHKSLIYQCFHEILSHLALFHFLIWHYFTYPFGSSLFSKMALEGIFAAIRTFTRYNRHERPPFYHRFRYFPVLCFPLQLSAAFDCITASSRSVCHLIFPLFYTGRNLFPVSFPVPYFAASSASERRF